MKISVRHIYIYSSLIVLAILISMGCKTSEKASGGEQPDAALQDTADIDQELSSFQQTLTLTRSKLSDVYTSQQHDMPQTFLKKADGKESLNTDPFDGYRVQIISTRDVQLADSVANQFRIWSDTTITGYSANAYVSFKQPFYKVHVGDFQKRNPANNFSRLVKQKYPDAWVVHDRINPSNAPADTASFSFITEKDSLQKAAADSL